MKQNKTKEKSLQKLTVSELMKKEIITKEELNSLSKDEQSELKEKLNDLILNSTGTKKDRAYKKSWELVDNETKNSLWEFNHVKIINTIHNELVNNFAMPTTSTLEGLTGISRQTISKHLKTFKDREFYGLQEQQFKIMKYSILKKLFKMSMEGDVKACKLYLEATGEANQNIRANQYIDKQQNNISINNSDPLE